MSIVAQRFFIQLIQTQYNFTFYLSLNTLLYTHLYSLLAQKEQQARKLPRVASGPAGGGRGSKVLDHPASYAPSYKRCVEILSGVLHDLCNYHFASNNRKQQQSNTNKADRHLCILARLQPWYHITYGSLPKKVFSIIFSGHRHCASDSHIVRKYSS